MKYFPCVSTFKILRTRPTRDTLLYSYPESILKNQKFVSVSSESSLKSLDFRFQNLGNTRGIRELLWSIMVVAINNHIKLVPVWDFIKLSFQVTLAHLKYDFLEFQKKNRLLLKITIFLISIDWRFDLCFTTLKIYISRKYWNSISCSFELQILK